MRNLFLGLTAVALATGALATTAKADVMLSGPTSNAGTYSTSALQGFAGSDPTSDVNYNGFAGVSLWGLLGGSTGITTTTPPGDNGKNAILRYYVTGSGGGSTSVVSAGEINPSFGGTKATPAFIAYALNGSTLAQPELIVPGQPARDLSTLGSLVLTSVAAQPNGSGGASTALTLSGQVANPGSYNATQLAALTPQTTVDVGGGTTYTGPPLASFLDATGNITSTIVDAVGTDGYTVAFALAEVDPAVGGNANDILAWAINGAPLTDTAVARLVFPSDNQRGRWNSNLDLLQVTDVNGVPEPATAGMLAAAIGLLGMLRRHTRTPERNRRTAASRAHRPRPASGRQNPRARYSAAGRRP
jgi:hypothetical protein